MEAEEGTEGQVAGGEDGGELGDQEVRCDARATLVLPLGLAVCWVRVLLWAAHLGCLARDCVCKRDVCLSRMRARMTGSRVSRRGAGAGPNATELQVPATQGGESCF